MEIVLNFCARRLNESTVSEQLKIGCKVINKPQCKTEWLWRKECNTTIRTIRPNEEVVPGILETGELDLQEQIVSHKTPCHISDLTVLDVDNRILGTTEAADRPTISDSTKSSIHFPVCSAPKWDTGQWIATGTLNGSRSRRILKRRAQSRMT